VDLSRGVLEPDEVPNVVTTPNLIQDFNVGVGLSRILQVKERSPSPVLASEVSPQILLEDLRLTPFPARRSVQFARRVTGAGGADRVWFGLNCRGYVGGLANDRLVVHYIRYNTDEAVAVEVALEVGRASGVGGLAGDFANLVSPELQAGSGTQLTDFTGGLSGSSADATDANAQLFLVVPGESAILPGPWILSQGEGIFVHDNRGGTPLNVRHSAFFPATEWPGT